MEGVLTGVSAFVASLPAVAVITAADLLAVVALAIALEDARGAGGRGGREDADGGGGEEDESGAELHFCGVGFVELGKSLEGRKAREAGDLEELLEWLL